MFSLNPLNNPDAFWQHAVMVIFAAILGYVIGYIGLKQTKRKLEAKLDNITDDLDKCLSRKSSPSHQSSAITEPAFNEIKKDDLKLIEGIGIKIEELLNSKGIYTFQQLRNSKSDELTEILKTSGTKFHMHDPRSWPQQAQLADNQMWDQLKELQEELNKGRFD